ncbi:uncharacterized protein LOC115243802 isoform X2 [Formica exsecta]|uniref:uncharacterized protein LOC115243802 isoform X2 n=1 Tax=Formica exsecta TaxID=72781 RepID=UPI001142AF6A|nr:uncharacterized protein LOC115243802 isoform X2 [Formica exsecta]
MTHSFEWTRIVMRVTACKIRTCFKLHRSKMRAIDEWRDNPLTHVGQLVNVTMRGLMIKLDPYSKKEITGDTMRAHTYLSTRRQKCSSFLMRIGVRFNVSAQLENGGSRIISKYMRASPRHRRSTKQKLTTVLTNHARIQKRRRQSKT